MKKKIFLCVNYYTAGEKSSEYKNILVKNLKAVTNWFNLGYWDNQPKTGTVPAKPGQLECLYNKLSVSLNILLAIYSKVQKRLELHNLNQS